MIIVNAMKGSRSMCWEFRDLRMSDVWILYNFKQSFIICYWWFRDSKLIDLGDMVLQWYAVKIFSNDVNLLTALSLWVA